MALAFLDKGPRKSDALLFFHGFMGRKEDWRAYVNKLNDTHRCLVPDLPGHGASVGLPPESYTMSGCAELVRQMLDTAGVEKVSPVGYSMGGRFALYFAVTFPGYVERLVLVSASPGLAEEAERRARIQHDEKLAQRLEAEGMASFLNDWYRQPVFASLADRPEIVRQLRSDREQQDPIELAKSLRGMGTGVQPSLWDRLPELPMPVLVLAGEKDGKFVAIARRMVDLCPRAELCIIPACGHMPHREQPEVFHRRLVQFIGDDNRSE
ncbi:MAG: 2-succinyl-6-hydroxy-2,4-cyclohexadiene-1-carboxylate synthase [Candidatus Zixiibacteriota bacterium]|nr:MAG: 2-succinyl-6-hydroxy-2,4-cyclohexadiene-1-carboxylate synthase [candidate division Zixibacteria bacterium]